jgi:hypothetical protein
MACTICEIDTMDCRENPAIFRLSLPGVGGAVPEPWLLAKTYMGGGDGSDAVREIYANDSRGRLSLAFSLDVESDIGRIPRDIGHANDGDDITHCDVGIDS